QTCALPIFLARTSRALLFRGRAAVRESRYCLRCGQEITNPASIAVGYGPECAQRLLVDHPGQLDLTDAEAIRAALQRTEEFQFWVPLTVATVVRPSGEGVTAQEPRPAPAPTQYSLTVDGNELVLRCPYEEREYAKPIPEWRWDKQRKAWCYPARVDILATIERMFPHLPIPDEARQAVELMRQAQQAVAELKAADDAEIDVPTNLPLYAHQRRMAAMALSMPAFAWLAEMGTGKTAAAVAVAGRRYLDGQISACLIVAPKSVLPVWEREFGTFAAFPYHV